MLSCILSFHIVFLCISELPISYQFKNNSVSKSLKNQEQLTSTLLVSQIVGRAPPGGRRDAMLEGASMTPGNMLTYKIFIENSLIYNEWGARNISSFIAWQEMIERH